MTDFAEPRHVSFKSCCRVRYFANGFESNLPSMQPKQAKSMAESAFDEKTNLISRGIDVVDEFTLARLERQAREGIKTEAILGYQALGLVGRYRWDHAAVDENFGAAIRLSGSAAVTANYASTLMSLDRISEAAIMSEKASAAEPTDLTCLSTAVESNWNAGRFERSLELLETLGVRSPNECLTDVAHRQQIVATLRQCEVSFNTVERLHAALYNFLSDKHVVSRGTQSYVDTSVGEESVFITVAIDRGEDDVRRLDEELTPVLFGAVEHFPLASFSIGLGNLGRTHGS
jgi:hypothetical protein